MNGRVDDHSSEELEAGERLRARIERLQNLHREEHLRAEKALADPGSYWCKELREENERLRAEMKEPWKLIRRERDGYKARIEAALAIAEDCDLEHGERVALMEEALKGEGA